MNEHDLLNSYRPWLRVVGYEGLYEVSAKGQVRSMPRVIDVAGHSKQQQRTIHPRILRAAPTHGYLAVSLWRENSGRTHPVHLLVAAAFLGLTPGVERPCHWCGTSVTKRAQSKLSPGGMTVDHVDHDIEHNAPGNLVPSCNPCNAHRLSGANWLPWEPGQPIGRDDLSQPTCRTGHAWNRENTYINPTTGKRSCRKCRRLAKRIWDDARRAA